MWPNVFWAGQRLLLRERIFYSWALVWGICQLWMRGVLSADWLLEKIWIMRLKLVHGDVTSSKVYIEPHHLLLHLWEAWCKACHSHLVHHTMTPSPYWPMVITVCLKTNKIYIFLIGMESRIITTCFLILMIHYSYSATYTSRRKRTFSSIPRTTVQGLWELAVILLFLDTGNVYELIAIQPDVPYAFQVTRQALRCIRYAKNEVFCLLCGWRSFTSQLR